MDLLDARKQFIEQSGRYDLVTDLDYYADDGADYYINAAVRELDTEIFQVLGARNIHYGVMEASTKFASLPRCRTIEQVWLINADSSKDKMTYLSLADLNNLDLSSMESPGYYSPVTGRVAPSLTTLDADDQTFISNTTTTFESDYRGIVISPAPTSKVVLEVHGLFYSAELVDDEDENYWTSAHPDILVKGAIRELERSYRNRQGAEDLSMAISEQLSKLDMDLAMDQASKTDEMRG